MSGMPRETYVEILLLEAVSKKVKMMKICVHVKTLEMRHTLWKVFFLTLWKVKKTD